MHRNESGVAIQFDDIEQQREASTLGMWVFLATEVLFFGGMMTAYLVYRHAYPDVFAEASHYMNILLGGINTGVLLGSSLTMALAVRSAQEGKKNLTVLFLVVTMILGCVFLGIKAIEYYQKYQEHVVPGIDFQYEGANAGGAQIYFILYFLLTGFHAVHLTIGIVVVGVIAFLASRNRYSAGYHSPVEVIGLYWHFVDIVWIFLYPLIYLIHAYK